MKQELVNNWVKEAQSLIALSLNQASPQVSEQIHQFAVSMLTAFFGENGPQLRAYLTSVSTLDSIHWGNRATQLRSMARGTLEGIMRQINSGLAINLRSQAKGEVFADLVALATDVLSNKSDEAKNTAAVLVAAAYEDVLRTLAADKANVGGRPKLEQVVNELKTAGVLQGGNVNMAVSYLKFRNDALHADWDKVTSHQVDSCLLFVESLIREYMS